MEKVAYEAVYQPSTKSYLVGYETDTKFVIIARITIKGDAELLANTYQRLEDGGVIVR
jgi:hypothetical protein